MYTTASVNRMTENTQRRVDLTVPFQQDLHWFAAHRLSTRSCGFRFSGAFVFH